MINHQPWEKSDVQTPNDLCCQEFCGLEELDVVLAEDGT